MEEKENVSEQTGRFLADLITISKEYKVDEHGAIFNATTGEPEMRTPLDSSRSYQLKLFGYPECEPEIEENFIVLNPWSHGSMLPGSDWITIQVSMIMSTLSALAIAKILKMAEPAPKNTKKKKKAAETTEPEVDMEVATVLGELAAKVDSRLLKEFEIFYKPVQGFMVPCYNASTATGSLVCRLFSDRVDTFYTRNQIRSGSIQLLRDIVLKILGVQSFDEFEYHPSSDAKRFETTVNEAVLVFNKLSKYADLIPLDTEALARLTAAVPNMQKYYNCAKWFNDPNQPIEKESVESLVDVDKATTAVRGTQVSEPPKTPADDVPWTENASTVDNVTTINDNHRDDDNDICVVSPRQRMREYHDRAREYGRYPGRSVRGGYDRPMGRTIDSVPYRRRTHYRDY